MKDQLPLELEIGQIWEVNADIVWVWDVDHYLMSIQLQRGDKVVVYGYSPYNYVYFTLYGRRLYCKATTFNDFWPIIVEDIL